MGIYCKEEQMRYQMLLILIIVSLWGLWGFLNKLAINKIGLQIGFWNILSFSITSVLFLIFTNQFLPLKKEGIGIFLALIAGVVSGLASMLFYILLDKKPAGLLVATTALYPLVTIILSVLFLQEQLTFFKILGFILALLALVFLNF